VTSVRAMSLLLLDQHPSLPDMEEEWATAPWSLARGITSTA